MGNTPSSAFRVEIGAWVESTTPKASGKGMRKVWVAPAPKGEPARLSVIRAGERGDSHVLTLHVGDEAAQSDALEALTLALDAFGALPAFAAPENAIIVSGPAPKARKAPTPPVAPAPAKERQTIIDKARADRAALSVAPKAQTRQPAPTPKVEPALDWFATLMHEAGAV